MSYKTLKTTVEIEAVDISTMEEMTIEEYKEYLKFGLVDTDHHDIVRSQVAGYPLACNRTQVNELIAHLKNIGKSLKD